MLEYIWIFFWLFGAGYVVSHSRTYRRETVAGIDEPVLRFAPVYAFILILPIILMAGYRGFWSIGDTGAYYKNFQNCPNTLSGLRDYIPTIQKDIGFYSITALIKLLISDARIYFLIIAAFQGICLLKLYRKYSESYILSLFLFVASTDIYSWMFNGIRQFVAVCITLLGIRFYLTKRYIPAIIIILIASQFHASAILLILFIFIVQGEAWNKKTLLFMGGAVLAVTFVGQFTSLMDSMLQGTTYENVVSDYTSWNDDGTNPIRVLVYSVPAILSFISRKHIRESGGKLINFCANMSIVSAGLYLISMVTSGIFIGRLPIYFSLYSYILLPWEINHLFAASNKSFVKIAMIVCYLGFYCFQIFWTW